ncbi:MAG TPA: preprotein translocase subunit SecA, partial [Gemmatimonadaceae bacterium]|nr:preprotein translocase subunit SecA [Gemmatimonadaceae bacterium]
NELGFDYLRDNMKYERAQMTQRGHAYAIVDEVDSILIDEARTPLIISGRATDAAELYYQFARIVAGLTRDVDYEVDEAKRTVVPTEEGVHRVEQALNVANLYEAMHQDYVHQLVQALKAKELFKRDVDYLVADGQVKIVDEFTGRILEGRRWSEGLHQAVEAKEGVTVRGETQTLSTITIQNYFRLYEKLAGMTGTAETEETEFHTIYGLDVSVIPTNKPIIRDDRQDLVYKTRREKYNGIVEETRRLHGLGFPVLVGTASVEASETLARMFQRAGLPHNVLNAKYHQREAEIVANAGQPGAITIATNMAGRGTDIKLGGGVRESKPSVVKDPDGNDVPVTEPGGLHIIGSERHESRRIDRQLRGRAGRQGDPGSSQFFLSLEDDLMRLFGSDRIARLMDGMGAKEGEVLTHTLITRSIEQAQKRVELQNFQARKRLLDYDDVMNQQREVIYNLRSFALEGGEELKGEAEKMVVGAVERRVDTTLAEFESSDDWDLELLRQELMMPYLLTVPSFASVNTAPVTIPEAKREAAEAVQAAFHRKFKDLGEYGPRLLSLVMLNVLDEKWKDHLYDLDQLRAAIQYRSWGQKDPLIEYKQEAFSMFEDLMRDIQHTFTERFLKVQLVFDNPPAPKRPPATPVKFDALGIAETPGAGTVPAPVAETAPAGSERAAQPKVVGAGRGVARMAAGAAPAGNLDFTGVGRNDPCPCGSGKKFKKCHGAT